LHSDRSKERESAPTRSKTALMLRWRVPLSFMRRCRAIALRLTFSVTHGTKAATTKELNQCYYTEIIKQESNYDINKGTAANKAYPSNWDFYSKLVDFSLFSL